MHYTVWSFRFWWLRATNPPNFSILPPWLSIPLVTSGGVLQIWVSYLASLMLCNDHTYFSKLRGFSCYENTLNKGSAFWQQRKDGEFTSWHKHHTLCHWLEDYSSKLLNSLLKFPVSKPVLLNCWLWYLISWNLTNNFLSKWWSKITKHNSQSSKHTIWSYIIQIFFLS